ncbi:MAG: type II 3-dehydroquinate dehydratase [Clostridia bacterium]|nr:type II 3-dehydroquinate dehydratase [Clostridia bacterium]
MKVLILNGVNLNMTGIREKGFYGSLTLDEINEKIKTECEKKGIECDFYQSNHEGDIVDKLHEARTAYDGVVLNAGAFTHYSYAIHDAISACEIPVVEVHMSNVHKREEFRHKSVLSDVCKGVIAGFGYKSYILGAEALLND